MTAQEALRAAWISGPEGKLCGREQAKAWALREVWVSEEKGSYGMFRFIAQRLKKTKNGKPTGGHPRPEAVGNFLRRSGMIQNGSQASTPTPNAGPSAFWTRVARRTL